METKYTSQHYILTKLFNIIGITHYNNKFSIHLLDIDSDKQKQIIELYDDIKLLFDTKNWNYINSKKLYLYIIINVVTEMNYNISMYRKAFEVEENVFFYDTIFEITKK